MVKLGEMVLKRVNWVHNSKIRSYCLERSQLKKLVEMVLKGFNLVHNAKFKSYGLERSQLGTQNLQKPWFSVKICKNHGFGQNLQKLVFDPNSQNHGFWSKSADFRILA